MPGKLSATDRQEIERAVEAFRDKKVLFKLAAEQLQTALRESDELEPFIHFIKYRIKEPKSLRKKLQRKALERREIGKAPNITAKNLFTKMGDLAGVRILHLHTEQIEPINEAIGNVFTLHRYKVREGPTAIVWDQQYRELYKSFGIRPQVRNSMYTSVHYVVQPREDTPVRVELQVRTLMEEAWGEVSHRVDYPEKTVSRACRDQLHVLARLTSGCTRLVDSIFKSYQEK